MMSHPAVKPAIWGAVVGAIGIMIAGFWGFGWMLASTADKMAKDQSEAAVVVAWAGRRDSQTRRSEKDLGIVGPEQLSRKRRLGDDAGKRCA
jgi:hypothetical protein